MLILENRKAYQDKGEKDDWKESLTKIRSVLTKFLRYHKSTENKLYDKCYIKN